MLNFSLKYLAECTTQTLRSLLNRVINFLELVIEIAHEKKILFKSEKIFDLFLFLEQLAKCMVIGLRHTATAIGN